MLRTPQALLRNPELLRTMLQANPQVRQLTEQNPEVGGWVVVVVVVVGGGVIDGVGPLHAQRLPREVGGFWPATGSRRGGRSWVNMPVPCLAACCRWAAC